MCVCVGRWGARLNPSQLQLTRRFFQHSPSFGRRCSASILPLLPPPLPPPAAPPLLFCPALKNGEEKVSVESESLRFGLGLHGSERAQKW